MYAKFELPMFTEYRKIHIVVIAKLGINIYIYIQTAMLGTREYTLCSPFRANAHNSSYDMVMLNTYIGALSCIVTIPSSSANTTTTNLTQ